MPNVWWNVRGRKGYRDRRDIYEYSVVHRNWNTLFSYGDFGFEITQNKRMSYESLFICIYSGDNSSVSTTLICSNRLYRFHAITFPKAPPSKTVSSTNKIEHLMDLLFEIGYCLIPVLFILDKRSLIMTVDEGHRSATEFPRSPQKAFQRMAPSAGNWP